MVSPDSNFKRRMHFRIPGLETPEACMTLPLDKRGSRECQGQTTRDVRNTPKSSLSAPSDIMTECHHRAFTSAHNPQFILDWITAARYWMGRAAVILLVLTTRVADGQHGPPVNRPSENL
jgi:hypothetical protein